MFNDTLNLLLQRADFFIDLSIEHFVICTLCIILSIIIGGGLGILISEVKSLSKPVLVIVNFLYTIPSIALLGFLLPFFGIGNNTAIIALTLYGLLPMVRNTFVGLTNVDSILIEAAKAMGSTNFQIFYKIRMPLAFRTIFSGIRTMVIMTIALAGIASFVGAGGLGVAIYRGITTNNQAMIVAGSLLIAIMALFTDALLGIFEKSSKKVCIFKRFVVTFSLFLAAFGFILSKDMKPTTIHIATKPMSEQYILANMMQILIENHTSLNAKITQGIGGGTFNIHPAMLKGDFDIYPEYTGTAWNMVLKQNDLYTDDKFQELTNQYKQKFDLEWINMYGFNNSYAIAVRSDIAKSYNLTKISDLKDVAQNLKFGAEYDFYEREDGYKPLSQVYRFKFKDTADLDIGLKYKAITDAKIDVMPIFTTDGLFGVSDLVILKDDLGFYPSYQSGTIVRGEILRQFPELVKVFYMLNGILDEKEMARLNYAVESKNESPKDVAMRFLQKRGLVQ